MFWALYIFFAYLTHCAYGSDVLVFTDANFDTNIKEHETALVEFYAPWCGHCQRLAPEYEAAATRLKGVVPLVKVDCTAETKVCGRFGVSGYPTLKIFKGGDFSSEYQGPRDADGIVKYMKTKASPATRLLDESAALDKLLAGVDPFVVGFFSSDASPRLAAFRKAAEKLSEEFTFAHSLSADINAKAGYKNEEIVLMQPTKLQSKFEPSAAVYDGSLEADSIKAWIETNIWGLAGVRTASNSKYFPGHPLVTAFYAVDFERNAKGTNYWRNRLMKIASKHSTSGLKFSIANTAGMRHELKEFGVESPDEQKVYVTARDAKGQKFVMQSEFSLESLEAFVGDLLADGLTPYLKSEPEPESQPDAVKVAVAKNFDRLVNDPAKDVLIEFYAPWCGHCKSLAPKYEELAQKLAGEPGLIIAKMDATANDVPKPYEVRGFPTIYFSPRGGKASPKVYNGPREVSDFLAYLAREATDELVGFDRSGNPKAGRQDL